MHSGTDYTGNYRFPSILFQELPENYLRDQSLLAKYDDNDDDDDGDNDDNDDDDDQVSHW